MEFNSYHFMVFFPMVVLLYYIIPRKLKCLWLLVASYYFYMSWNAWYAILILFSTFATYLSGLFVDRVRDKKRKLALWSCIIANLLILGIFKYLDFALDTISSILGHIGFGVINNPFDLLLPVGISFYTFQAIGYVIDVYRGTISAEKSFLRYALFVSFFPQLVAGPIERSGNLLGQIDDLAGKGDGKSSFKCSFSRVQDGLLTMLYGLFLKMVIADRISIFVDTIYNDWQLYGGVELLAASIGFALQIYCDFSGYSTIAIGAAKVLGFDLMENFAAPYYALSIKEFWTRWHISLSTWFRDYIYIPLGGNRHGKLKKYRNLMITFLVSGLWHGANWTFVVWGGLHAVYQILGECLSGIKEKLARFFDIRKGTAFANLLAGIGTFVLVDFAWIFFRADSISSAIGIIRNIWRFWNPWAIWDGSLHEYGLSLYQWRILFAGVLILLIVDRFRYKKKLLLSDLLRRQGGLFTCMFFVGLSLMILIFGIYGAGYDAANFIYFQF